MKRCRFYSVYGLKKSNFKLSFLQTFVLFCSFLAPRGPCEGRVILVRGLTGEGRTPRDHPLTIEPKDYGYEIGVARESET